MPTKTHFAFRNTMLKFLTYQLSNHGLVNALDFNYNSHWFIPVVIYLFTKTVMIIHSRVTIITDTGFLIVCLWSSVAVLVACLLCTFQNAWISLTMSSSQGILGLFYFFLSQIVSFFFMMHYLFHCKPCLNILWSSFIS